MRRRKDLVEAFAGLVINEKETSGNAAFQCISCGSRLMIHRMHKCLMTPRNQVIRNLKRLRFENLFEAI